MRVLLISANTESITMPVLPIGLAAVAAATKLQPSCQDPFEDVLFAPSGILFTNSSYDPAMTCGTISSTTRVSIRKTLLPDKVVGTGRTREKVS